MGCGASKQGSRRSASPQPVRVPLGNVSTTSARASHRSQPPQRTERAMTQQIRTEFLSATQRAFGNLEYGVIGGIALAEYGNRRATSDLDVMVPHNISNVAEGQLLQHGMTRTAGRGIG